MGQGKKVIGLIALCVLTLNLAACGSMADVFDPTNWASNDGDSSDDPSAQAIEATETYSIPLGGVADGRDELVIYDSAGHIKDFTDSSLTFQTSNDKIELQVREGYQDFGSGSGALIVPKEVGTTIVNYSINGVEQSERYLVIVPPQSLVQALIGEARGQIEGEAQLNDDGFVALTSESPTANAIAAVVRNRVLLLEAGYPLNLFMVDETAWSSSPVASHWDSVITAEESDVFQFSPVDPETMSHDEYIAAASRDGLLDESELIAYDQVVLTAAGIFSNDINDPTGGAFAFRTPTLAQTECFANALDQGLTDLPAECGSDNDNYPAFAPVQILIHPSVANLNDGRPSFIFIRSRDEDEPAVTNAP